MNTYTTTPWGASQDQEKIAPGITRHDAASHGGYHLSAERLAELPPELRKFRPWAGPGWFEEDCDWCVVVLSFPQYFSERHSYYAVRTAETAYSRPSNVIGGELYEINAAALRGFLSSERGRALVDAAKKWEAEHANVAVAQ